MIKWEHSVFALPFALCGAMLAAGGLPSLHQALWIMVAMVSARSAAMAFNRLADVSIDAANPRTRTRALPAGILSGGFVSLFVVVTSAMQKFLSVRAVYSGVIDRLKASNIEGAVNLFTNVIRENYRTAFAQAGSGLSAMVDGFGTVKGMRLNGDFAELLVVRATVEGDMVFSVFLVQDGDGIWRIDGF